MIDAILNLTSIGLITIYIIRLLITDSKVKDEQTKLLQESFKQLEKTEENKAGGTYD